MARRSRGPRIALPALLLGTAVIACTPTLASPTPPSASATAAAPGTAAASASAAATPVPTPAGTAGPTEPPPAGPAGLLIRLTGCSDTCGPEPGTTILTDGRVIWQDEALRPLEARLTQPALARVRDELAASRVLARNGDYQAKLRPGASPVGHGATLYRFDYLTDGRHVIVTSGNPGDYADQADSWVIPPEMPVLARLAQALAEPLSWLGAESFEARPKAYVPDRYLVVIELFPEVGLQPGLGTDVDTVAWPFGRPIEGVGEPADAEGGGLGTRCLVVDRAQAQATAAAEREAGARRDFSQWLSTVEFGWKRADGFVDVSLTPLLPHETGSCVDLMPKFP